MAAQLTFTKGLSARLLCRWMARAMSSLPVPLSPVMRTRPPVGATFAMICFTSRMAALSPNSSSSSFERSATLRESWTFSRTFRKETSTRSRSSGFSKKS